MLEATIECMGRFGIAKTTVDDVAKAAGVSRASVYRYFPDGKDQLVSESILSAVEAYFSELGTRIRDAEDFPTFLELALIHGRRAVVEHEVLQKVLETEPERLLPHLTQSAPLVLSFLRPYLSERLEGETLRPGVGREDAADWLARMGLSFTIATGGWDLTDPAEVRRLVRRELLAPVLAEPVRGSCETPPDAVMDSVRESAALGPARPRPGPSV